MHQPHSTYQQQSIQKHSSVKMKIRSEPVNKFDFHINDQFLSDMSFY